MKADITAPKTYKKSKLSYVGCENCSAKCCDGTKFDRTGVLLHELYDVAKLFPVVFKQKEPGGNIKMELIFSFKKGVPCLYFDSDSKKCSIWDSVKPYPCRSYPFKINNIQSKEGARSQFSIKIDTKFCKGVKESSEGINIFTDNNEITEEVLDKFFGRDNLANLEKNLMATNEFLDLVNELDLLVGAVIVPEKKPLSAGKSRDDIFPIQKICEQKLGALDTDSLKRLQRPGYIDAINIHLRSLANFKKLIQAMNAFEKSVQPNS